MRTAVEDFGSLDVVANNAGYANSAPIAHTSDALRIAAESSAERAAEAERWAETSRSADYA